jgi:phage tail-like protein
MTPPFPAYNFRVNVDTAQVSFSEVSGIEVAYKHVIYRHGLSFSEGEDIVTFPVKEFSPITMKRGVVSVDSAFVLYSWLTARELRRIEVHLLDFRGNASLIWRVEQAVPVKLSAPTFDANTNDVAIETLEVMAKGVSLVRG